jgi:hypothetical protein
MGDKAEPPHLARYQFEQPQGDHYKLRGTRSALLLSRSEDGTLDFDSSPVVILSAQQAKHVGDEENQQYCPQPNAGPAARTPAGMAVVPSTEAENQY